VALSTSWRFVPIGFALSACASAPSVPPAQPQPQAPAGAASPQPAYSAMAPIAQYREASTADEVAFARSAAPPSVSDQADVLVLGERGYTLAEKGSNGFVCILERSWAKDFDDPEFFSPKVRGPNCYNQAAARSVLPVYLQRTEWVLAAVPVPEMVERTKAAVASGQIHAPEVGSMCFMMSKRGHLSDEDGHWHPHVMLYLPRTKAADWGANLKGSAVFAVDEALVPITIFLVPVRKWSDGTLDMPT